MSCPHMCFGSMFSVIASHSDDALGWLKDRLRDAWSGIEIELETYSDPAKIDELFREHL